MQGAAAGLQSLVRAELTRPAPPAALRFAEELESRFLTEAEQAVQDSQDELTQAQSEQERLEKLEEQARTELANTESALQQTRVSTDALRARSDGLQNELAEMLLAGDIGDGQTVEVSAGSDGLLIGDRVAASNRTPPADAVVH